MVINIILIWTIFFIQLVIPSFVLLEIGIRGKAALSVIGFFSLSQPELILASSLAPFWTPNASHNRAKNEVCF